MKRLAAVAALVVATSALAAFHTTYGFLTWTAPAQYTQPATFSDGTPNPAAGQMDNWPDAPASQCSFGGPGGGSTGLSHTDLKSGLQTCKVGFLNYCGQYHVSMQYYMAPTQSTTGLLLQSSGTVNVPCVAGSGATLNLTDSTATLYPPFPPPHDE